MSPSWMHMVHGDGPNGEMFTDCFYTLNDRPTAARLRGHLQPQIAEQRIEMFRIRDAQKRENDTGGAA